MCPCLSLSTLRAHHSQHTLTTPGDLSTYRDIFEQYKRGNGTLGLNELADLFLNVSKKITALPATAQVASQQGAYLGKKFAKLGRQELDDTALRNGVYDDPDDLLADPFNYRHLGSLAYIVRSLSGVVQLGERALTRCLPALAPPAPATTGQRASLFLPLALVAQSADMHPACRS